MAGMPVGPLSLNDEVALDLGWKILKATEADLGAEGHRPAAEDAARRRWSRSTAASAARTARASTTIRRTGPKRLWPGLADLQPTKLDPDTIDVAELKQRLLAVQALEAARSVEEGVITDVREADVGSILGFGFAPFTGGTLSYIDMMGTQGASSSCARSWRRNTAPRFTPPKLLRRHGGQGRDLLRPLCRPDARRRDAAQVLNRHCRRPTLAFGRHRIRSGRQS